MEPILIENQIAHKILDVAVLASFHDKLKETRQQIQELKKYVLYSSAGGRQLIPIQKAILNNLSHQAKREFHSRRQTLNNDGGP